MSVILGSGEHRYEVIENWAKLPDGWEFKGTATAERGSSSSSASSVQA